MFSKRLAFLPNVGTYFVLLWKVGQNKEISDTILQIFQFSSSKKNFTDLPWQVEELRSFGDYWHNRVVTIQEVVERREKNPTKEQRRKTCWITLLPILTVDKILALLSAFLTNWSSATTVVVYTLAFLQWEKGCKWPWKRPLFPSKPLLHGLTFVTDKWLSPLPKVRHSSGIASDKSPTLNQYANVIGFKASTFDLDPLNNFQSAGLLLRGSQTSGIYFQCKSIYWYLIPMLHIFNRVSKKPQRNMRNRFQTGF